MKKIIQTTFSGGYYDTLDYDEEKKKAEEVLERKLSDRDLLSYLGYRHNYFQFRITDEKDTDNKEE